MFLFSIFCLLFNSSSRISKKVFKNHTVYRGLVSIPPSNGNALNMYLNPMIHGSIFTKDKNSTRERGGEDREVAVRGPPKMVGSGLLH
jgi:hypothetical protein